MQLNEEKLLKELNETRTLHINQLNDYKRRIEQLELEKEQLRRVEVVAPVQAAPVLSDEDREKIEQLTKENEQYKSKLTEIQVNVCSIFALTCFNTSESREPIATRNRAIKKEFRTRKVCLLFFFFLLESFFLEL